MLRVCGKFLLILRGDDMKINIITYGCTANQGDSYLMESVLEKAGHKITDFDDADYVIVNTCAVKEATENKIASKLSKLAKSDKKIIVGGCLTKVSLKRIKKSVPNFSGILDTRSVDKLPEIIKGAENGRENQIIFSDQSPVKPNLIKNPHSLTGIVQISEGCDLSCTYCATTIARGDLQCFSKEEIVRAASYLVRNGSKEILLTSQDNGAYNLSGVKLPKLLTSICNIEVDFFLRNGMTNPVYLNSIITPLIVAYENPKIYKFLHIPVQSGSNSILKKMKRGYTAETFRKFVSEFRKNIPKLTLSTDIIVGFPEETTEDFTKTKELLKEIRFDIVNLSKFGPRPGTEATKMEQLERGIVNKRSSEISSLIKKIYLEKNREWVGWQGPVLVNQGSDLVQIGKEKSFIARNIYYKPISIKTGSEILGKTLKVKIIGSTAVNLIGEIA